MISRSPTRTNISTQDTTSSTLQDSSVNNNLNSNMNNNQSMNRISQLDLDICASAIKLPQFWTNCPDAWFVHAEMQFATKGITTDQTKYEYIITALPQDVIVKVLDFIQNPTASERYINLKKILIERHSLSENSKLDKILSDSDMGDRKPSEYYRSLALLAGSNFSQDVLTKLWLRKLPKSLNVALTGSNISDRNELIQLADRLWEVIYNGEINSIRSSRTSNMEQVVQNLTASLCENINKLTLEVSSLKNELEHRTSRPSYRRYNRSNSRSRGRSQSRNWLCRFHYRFGSQARKCEQPCSFSKENSTN